MGDIIFAIEGSKRWAKALRDHAGEPCEYTADDLRRAAKWLDDIAEKELRPLGEIKQAATDLVELWKAQKVAGLPRAERNAAIEESRTKLIALIDSAT